ncbi:MAG: glycosyltransferase family 87 protein, partial [Chloroflexota bacterium]
MLTSTSTVPKAGLLLRLLLVLIAILTWSDFGVRVFLPAVQAPHWPNPAYWVAARLAVEGNANLIYADRDVFFQQASRLGTVPDIFEANMPTTILVFLPLGVFSETTARTIWDVLMLFCYLMACALLFRSLAPTRTVEIGLWALAPVFHPWRENISRGQAYPLLLLLLVIGAQLGFPRAGKHAESQSKRKSRRELAAGLAFGLLAVVKLYYAAILLLPALFWRRWRLLMGAIAFFAVAACVTVAVWGSEQWVRAIGFAIAWRDRPESAVTAYQTLNSWLTHLLRYDATYNPAPVANLPALVGPLWWAGAVIIVTLTCWALYEHRRSTAASSATSAKTLLPVALVVPLALLLAPVAED